MAEHKLYVIDGWATDDQKQLEHALRRPPTTLSYRAQLARDARSWKTLAFWLGGPIGFAVGCFTHNTAAYAIGGAIWGVYLLMFLGVVSSQRRGRLVEAQVQFSERHPKVHHLLTGSFRDPDTGTLGKAVLDDWAVEQFKRPNGTVPVLIQFSPGDEYHGVVGIRGLDWVPPSQ